MHLAKYLEEHRIAQGAFGSELIPPASQSLVSQWVLGRTRITLDYALQIQRKTKNKVAPEDCNAMYIGSAEAAAS